jgi:hypothetical protein
MLDRRIDLLPARLAVAAASLALLAGCQTLDVPRAENYPASTQQKMRSAHHWDVLAQDVARRVVQQMLSSTMESNGTVQIVGGADTDFERALRSLLATRLHEAGLRLVQRDGDLRLSVEAQVVQHPDLAGARNRVQLPATALAAGIGVIRNWREYGLAGFGAGVQATLATGALIDIRDHALNGPAAGGPTRTELLVSVNLARGAQVVARTSDLYYLERPDAVLYREAPPPPTGSKAWTVVGE